MVRTRSDRSKYFRGGLCIEDDDHDECIVIPVILVVCIRIAKIHPERALVRKCRVQLLGSIVAGYQSVTRNEILRRTLELHDYGDRVGLAAEKVLKTVWRSLLSRFGGGRLR